MSCYPAGLFTAGAMRRQSSLMSESRAIVLSRSAILPIIPPICESMSAGLAVAPGFIDIHSHALRGNEERSGIFLWPDAENLIRQGVTSVIGGPDGNSPLPIAEYFARLEENPAAVNFGTFVGQGSVRGRL